MAGPALLHVNCPPSGTCKLVRTHFHMSCEFVERRWSTFCPKCWPMGRTRLEGQDLYGSSSTKWCLFCSPVLYREHMETRGLSVSSTNALAMGIKLLEGESFCFSNLLGPHATSRVISWNYIWCLITWDARHKDYKFKANPRILMKVYLQKRGVVG